MSDLIKRAKALLVQCGPCDYGLAFTPCACPERYDPRPIIQELVEEIERRESNVRERVALDIETELAAIIRDAPTRSPRRELAYRTAAHIARGGACIANPRGVNK